MEKYFKVKKVKNVSMITFLFSMVMGILVSFVAKVHEKGGCIVFCCPPKQIATIFSITKLDKISQIYNTEDEALGSFK